MAQNSEWWHGGIIYQIYPRSYQDSNSDGIGDLKGITRRLDHIAELGADAIWISPFFTSPMEDFGYDVSDYRDVDPMFGSLADFDALLARAHELGLKVMIDLVMSHSSAKHPWFEESRQSRDNDKADWYVWADPQPDGTPPNNWLSIFGGPAWQWDTRREQYYMHNFLVSQPDFNFHNKDVQQAHLDVARFWLERGVDGFRLDTINFYFHDKQLRSNPALSIEDRNASIAPSVNPYNHQEHLYSKNQPENLAFLERLRAVCDEFEGRACLGEVGDAQYGLEIMGQYTDGDNRMHMCYAFEFLESRPATATWVKSVFDKLDQTAPDAWPCWAFSNHDVVRASSRWGMDDAAKRAYLMLILSMRGSVGLYQGEELGLPEATVAFEDLQDPYGIEFWPEFKGRDGCRTPMVWEKDAPNGGFSDAKPWLPVDPKHLPLAVDSDNPLLTFYRTALPLRRQEPTLARGTQSAPCTEGDLLCFVRELEGTQIHCYFNLGSSDVTASAPASVTPIAQAQGGMAPINGAITLPPWGYALLKGTSDG